MTAIESIVPRIIHNIKQYKYTILTMVYLCLIVLHPVGFSLRILPLLGCLSIVLILHIISRLKLTYLYAAILIILITFNACVSFAYSSYISYSIIGVIFETNTNEIKSALSGLFFPVLILLIITSLLVIFSIRELRNTRIKIRYSIFMLLIFLGLLSTVTYRWILVYTDLRTEYNKYPLDTFSKALIHYTPLLYGNIAVITSYLNDIYEFNESIHSEKEMPEGITHDSSKEQATKLFIVIGESANYKHLSLFGYEYSTTPFVDSLAFSTDKILFFKGKSIASQTKNAVPGILSNNTAKDTKAYRETYSVIELAKSNGYTTYWISNQSTDGLWNGRDIINVLAGQTNHPFFLHESELLDDFMLLPELTSIYKNDDSKQLFIIHLQGSHFLYKDRYDEVDVQQLPGEETIALHYDRSIHHTDRFLKSIYDLVRKNNSSILFYLSDHGQEVQEVFGHGVGKPTKNQFAVPIIAINNSAIPLDSIMNKYIDPNDSIMSNNSIPYIASELIGYSVSGKQILKSIEDGRFVLHGDDVVYKYSDLE